MFFWVFVQHEWNAPSWLYWERKSNDGEEVFLSLQHRMDFIWWLWATSNRFPVLASNYNAITGRDKMMEGLRMSSVIWARLTYERNGVWGCRHDLGHEQHEDGQREQHGDTCRHKRVISFMFLVRSSNSQFSDIFYNFTLNASLSVLFCFCLEFEPFWKCGGSNLLVSINETPG